MILDDEYYMRLALAEAEKAYELGEIPVGCVVVAQDRIIAKTHNLTEQLIDVTAHAEVQAISAAANHIGGKYLKNCTMYITLEPCVMCAGALYWSQISKVVIGATDEKRGYISAGLQLHPKTEIVTGVLSEESQAILQDFFKQRR
ncbi:MAG TPA: nucleoside deaminase [Flavobacterium sp.]|nr:nucleoside deaminase [Flavobacterium sp.]